MPYFFGTKTKLQILNLIFGAVFVLVSIGVQIIFPSWGSRPIAVMCGAIFTALNIKLFTIVASALVGETRSNLPIILFLLFKIPIIGILIYVLTRYGAEVVLSAIFGFCSFIPTSLVVCMSQGEKKE